MGPLNKAVFLVRGVTLCCKREADQHKMGYIRSRLVGGACMF